MRINDGQVILNIDRLTAEESNLLFSIISIYQTHISKNVVSLSAGDERVFGSLAAKDSYNHEAAVMSALNHLLGLSFTSINSQGNRVVAVLFTQIEWLSDSPASVNIHINATASCLLGQLPDCVAKALGEYQRLRSGYAKTMFRILKRHHSSSSLRMSKRNFFEELELPTGYWHRPENIESRVLRPILTELQPLFSDLKLEKIRGHGRGNPIEAYQFTWTNASAKMETNK